MKKRIEKKVEVEVSVCNICGQEITKEPFNKERIKIVRALFDTSNFDAHEACINKIIKNAFKEYIEPYYPERLDITQG